MLFPDCVVPVLMELESLFYFGLEQGIINLMGFVDLYG
jgi:hypothetical protein